MATYTFHNSKADGTPDQAITSGQVGALFSLLTSQERITGDNEFSKVWITSDTDVTAYIGLDSPSPYSSNVFVSANDSDAEGDLTGSEDRYGALEVTAATTTLITVKNNPDYTLARAADGIIVAGAAYEIDTVTDNGDGTSGIKATIDFTALPAVGDYITTVIPLTLVTATARPFWRQEKVAPGSTYVGAQVSARIVIAD